MAALRGRRFLDERGIACEVVEHHQAIAIRHAQRQLADICED